jgi:pimeloyl-ACP methyl ester carboxylesterase
MRNFVQIVVGVCFACALAACGAPAQSATSTQPPAAPVDLLLTSGDVTLAATLKFPSTGRAPFPAIVLAHGSGRLTRDNMQFLVDRFLAMGLAVLSYDKRGVGASTGEYVSVGTAGSMEVFDYLADDALAGVAALKTRKDVDARNIGLGGMSQAGWIIPLAASKSKDVAFLVILSGPAVTVGEEMEYSRLAGADPGSIQGLSDAEIDRQMSKFDGPHGYNPRPVLEKLDTPSIWIEGEQDRSVPMAQTFETLERLRAAGRPITIVKLPGADHSLRNPVTGERPDFWPQIREWLSDNSERR